MFDDKHCGESDRASRSRPRPPLALSRLPGTNPRRRIFAAMIHTVARRGYDRTTLTRVLAAAHLPEAVFCEHFDDKRDCFMQAVDELIGTAERAALEEFSRPVAWHERVHNGLRLLLEGMAHDEDAARVVFVEMLAGGPAAQERQRACMQLFASLIEEGRREMQWPDALPTQMSEAIVGGIASILQRRVLQGEVFSLPTLLADLTYFALLPYLDEERAMRVAELRTAA